MKINTLLSLGVTFSQHGGMKNVAIQIVSTDYIRRRLIELQFKEGTTGLKLSFSRINNAYFYPSETTHCGINNVTQVKEIRDRLKFTVDVQAFSNINQVVKIYIDMVLENKHKLKPDNILRCEFCSETSVTTDGIQRDNTRNY